MENQKNGEKKPVTDLDYRALYERSEAEREVLRARVELLLGGAETDGEAVYEPAPAKGFWARLKRALYRNRYTRKICKGLICWRDNGLAYTLRRVKERLCTHPTAVKKVLYTDGELEAQRGVIFPKQIKISILVPLYNTPERFLDEMISSVTSQTYANWELCLADGSDDTHPEVGEFVKRLAEKDPRILYRKLEKNLGISGNTNACIDMASGNYIALFDHDDILHPAALYEVMCAICEKDADFVYTDEATFESPDLDKIITAHFKPDFAPDNLRANNYICHLSVFSREVLDRAGRFRSEYDGSQDHDMILRLTSAAEQIVHIPKLLYYWRSHPQSVAMDIDSKGYAIDAGKRAVRDSIRRDGGDARVESSRAFPTIYRIRYDLKDYPKVSILIPNKNHLEDLRRCVESILSKTTYPLFEIVIVDNGSDDPALLEYYETLKQYPIFKLCSLDIPFNYPKLNNRAAEVATGDYFLLLNNDTEVISPAWIEEMLMYAQRDDVAAVGAKLYYPDHTIQHAGIVLKLGKDRVAGHAFYKDPRGAVGYMGRLWYAQNVSAVTAACMLVKASAYREVGGFDESLAVAYNDVDFCLRLREKGYLLVWTPYAELYHYESKSRGADTDPERVARFEAEAELFRTRWKETLELGDPYYNPNLTLDKSDFSPQ